MLPITMKAATAVMIVVFISTLPESQPEIGLQAIPSLDLIHRCVSSPGTYRTPAINAAGIVRARQASDNP
jgi:hypothetical protein